MSWKEKFTPTSDTLTLHFDSVKEAEVFKTWLCNSGEQFYDDFREVMRSDGELPKDSSEYVEINYQDLPNHIFFKAEG